MTDTTTEQDQRTELYTGEPGDDERLSHYVPKHALEAAILNGTPCIALCGKTWLPTRDATRFPVCPECKDAYDQLPDAPGGDQ